MPAYQCIRQDDRAVASSADESDLQSRFQAFIKDVQFPCVGAKSALVQDQLTLFQGGDIDRPSHDVELHTALHEFGDSLEPDSPLVQSFAALFEGPRNLSEAEFETALWNRLQCLHNLDVVSGESWNEQTSRDPDSAHFSMSVGGHAFFIIGLHPNASRPARRFDTPAMVFNSHAQFERLREDGRFDKMKKVIRERDAAIAGDVNPMIADYGDGSEARQYSGRQVGSDWQAPFEPKKTKPG